MSIIAKISKSAVLAAVVVGAVLAVLITTCSECSDRRADQRAARDADEGAAAWADSADARAEMADSLEDVARYLDGRADAAGEAADSIVASVPALPKRVETRGTPQPAAIPDLDSALAVIAVLEEDNRRLIDENMALRSVAGRQSLAIGALEKAFADMASARDTWRDTAREFELTTVAQAEQIDFMEAGVRARDDLITTLGRQRRGWKRMGLGTGAIAAVAVGALILTH